MALTLAALVLFAQDRIALETSSLLVFITLIAGFQIFPYEGDGGPVRPSDLFAGFGHEALVAVCALMVLGKGLETTGALQPVARILARVWQTAPVVSLLFTMVVAGALSAVVNNTPIVVMLLPILVGVTLSAKSSPSGVLMPFGLATVIGGTVTTIGTSTNLLVVSVARDMGVHEFRMFEFALPMTLVGVAGIAYLWLITPRLLPARAPDHRQIGPAVQRRALRRRKQQDRRQVAAGGAQAGRRQSAIARRPARRRRSSRAAAHTGLQAGGPAVRARHARAPQGDRGHPRHAAA
jgi:di/tricarboxylate transporter